jgi:DNA-binding beta-propeller fold protein YncE
MPEPRPLASSEAKRNFLFAALAFQLELLSRSRLDQAWQTWTSQRILPLPDLLRQRGWLGAEEQGEVERVLARKLQRHGGDVHLCLAELISGADHDYLAGIAPPGLLGQRRMTGNGSQAIEKPSGPVGTTNDDVPAIPMRRAIRRFLPNHKILARVTTAAALVLLIALGASLLGPPLMERYRSAHDRTGGAAGSDPNTMALLRNMAIPGIRIMGPKGLNREGRPRSESDKIKAYEDRMEQAQNAWAHGIMGQLRDALVSSLPGPADKVDRRGPEWYLLWRQYQARERSLISPEQFANGANPLTHVVFANSGNAIAATGPDGRIRIWDPKNETQLQSIAIALNKPIADSRGVVFSHDDKLVACGRANGELAFFDVATGKLVRALNTEFSELGSFAWSPDNKRIVATSAQEPNLKIFSYPAGKAVGQITVNDGATKIVDLAYSPAGDLFALAGTDGLVRLYDAATGKALASFDCKLPREAVHLHRLAFSPDGKLLAVAGEGSKISVREAASGKETHLLDGLQGQVNGVAYSRDGRRIAAVSAGGGLSIWSAPSGRQLYSAPTVSLSSIAFSPDGQRLAAVGNGPALKVWDASRLEMDDMVERSAEQIAAELLARYGDRLKLVDHLRKDPKLSEPVRQAVLRRAGPQIAFDLNNHSWLSVAQKANASPEDCRRAVREAEEACRLVPGDGNYINTLGVVQYRAKQYDKALATMLQSTRINREKEFLQDRSYLPGPHYSDLAFLGMCYARKGQSGEAKKMLGELEKLMESTAWKNNGEAQVFLAEAQKLIGGQARAGLPQ